MTDKQSRVVREIVKFLIDHENVRATELSEVAQVSRPTVLKVLGYFTDDKIIDKKGTGYGFYGRCAAVFVTVNEQRGEISAYSLGEGNIYSAGFDFSDMLTFNDNVLRLCKRAEEYTDFLKTKYGNVICCFIDGRTEKMMAFSPPAFFDLSVGRDLLIMDAMNERVSDGSGIYIDEHGEYMLICVGGRKIKEMRVISEDLALSVSEIVRVLHPEAAVIDMPFGSEKAEEVRKIFETNRIRTEYIGDGRLCTDKRDALIRVLCAKAK